MATPIETLASDFAEADRIYTQVQREVVQLEHETEVLSAEGERLEGERDALVRQQAQEIATLQARLEETYNRLKSAQEQKGQKTAEFQSVREVRNEVKRKLVAAAD